MCKSESITINDLENFKDKMKYLDTFSKQFIAGIIEGIKYERSKNKDMESEEENETT